MKKILILLSGVICFPVLGDDFQEYGISVKSSQANGMSKTVYLNYVCGSELPESYKVNGEDKELSCSPVSSTSGADLGEVKIRQTVSLFVTKSNEFNFNFESTECGSYKTQRSWQGEAFTFKGQTLKGCDLTGKVTKR
jgi:hypothetical protein